MFWSEVENNPKHRVKECPGVHFFNQDEDLNDTLDIFDEILKVNYEDSIHESIDEHFDLLAEHDEPCERDEDPGEAKDNMRSIKVPSKRRKPSSKRIQWWRFFTFESFY